MMSTGTDSSVAFRLHFILFGEDVADRRVVAFGHVSVAAVDGVRRRRIVLLLLPPVGATGARGCSWRGSFSPPHCNSINKQVVIQ